MKLSRKINGSAMGYGNRGFTLIELLVVIAIIRVLSSIVLASLNQARSKGANAAIKQNMSNIRAQAEIYYDTNNSYGASYTVAACPTTSGGTTLFGDSNIYGMITAAKSASGDSTGNRCYSSGSAWATSIPLKTAEGTYTHWCVDSKGNSIGRTNSLQTASTDCNT